MYFRKSFKPHEIHIQAKLSDISDPPRNSRIQPTCEFCDFSPLILRLSPRLKIENEKFSKFTLVIKSLMKKAKRNFEECYLVSSICE